MEYHFSTTESNWRFVWDKTGAHHTDLAKNDRKFYGLVMFSYPSAKKLHIGHWYNFAPADSFFRWKRMQGYNVFEPMGFDSFGLPAENYAVSRGVHPGVTTAESVTHIREQLKQIGAMYDWTREVNTSSPEYYRWTQWLFLQLFNRGLAYQKQAPVNWCTSCQTVLANEQAEGGTCERCGTTVIKRDLKQWFLRITQYADRLLEGLSRIDWPRKTKLMQENWIGRSEGAMISFGLVGQASPLAGNTAAETPALPDTFEIFTTRPDTLYGVTYMVFAPEHPLVAQIATPEQRSAIDIYIERVRRATDIERTSTEREKIGVFTGAYAIHPLTGDPLQIWIADYVLMGYGTGAVMAVPAHDQRDFEFAKKYSLPVRVVIQPPGQSLDPSTMDHAYEDPGIMLNSAEFEGKSSEDGKSSITQKLDAINKGHQAVTYRLRDWLVSRQRYWGAPIPIIHCDVCGLVPVPEDQLPVRLPEAVKEFAPKGKSPLAAIPEFMEVECPLCGHPARRDPDTMDTFVDSSWYFLRYLSPDRDDVAWDAELSRSWLPVDQYIGGAEHSVMHLLYARFIIKALYDAKLVSFDEPFTRLRHQGIITHKGDKMSKSRGNVVNPDAFVDKYGSDVFRMYMMFMGDYEQGGDWSDEGITGIARFVNRLYTLYQDHLKKSEAGEPSGEVCYALHYAIQHVSEDLENLHFNTAISRMMELLNTLLDAASQGPENSSSISPPLEKGGQGGIPGLHSVLDTFARLVAPFAPHLGEELWHLLHPEKNDTDSVFDQPWPEYDPAALVRDHITLVVQINGKLRDKLEVPPDIDQESVVALAKASERLTPYLEGKQIRKVIFVPGKLLNLVVG